MKKIVISEHGQIHRWAGHDKPPENTMSLAFLSEALYRKLEKNEARLNASGEPVFICYKDYLKAQQWVGVIQIPGLLIEILPKVDNADQRSRELVESHW